MSKEKPVKGPQALSKEDKEKSIARVQADLDRLRDCPDMSEAVSSAGEEMGKILRDAKRAIFH